MPPVKSKEKYVQKYKISWQTEPQFKDWLRPFSGNNTRAYCAFCRTDFAAHRRSLEEHAQTKRHTRNVESDKVFQSIPKLTTYMNAIDFKRKVAELKIAAFVAEHCSVKAVDHLSEIIQSLDKSSGTLSQIKLHRTKCTALILNVLSPCFSDELIEDVGNSNYSLIIDETTAIDVKKVMCIMIRYFSLSRHKVHTTFYRLLELHSGTAEHITECLKKQLEDAGLKLENLLGIGVDGAITMVGPYNSVTVHLKKIIPHLVSVKCLTHSLHLSAEHACDMLPKNLDFLVKASQSWFSRSTNRNINYEEVHRTISDDTKPKKTPKLSGTRWLARLDAINAILDQWESLELHFNTSRYFERGDAGFKADMLYQMYNCVENKLYLIFLRYSLKEVISLNKLFQSNSAECLKLFQDLNNLLFSVLQSIVLPQKLEKADKKDLCSFEFKKHLMPTDCINFGFYFNELSSKCNPENLKMIKNRCKDFLIKLAEELQMRVPNNIKLLEKMCVFTPDIASRQSKPDISEIANFFKAVCLDVDETIKEWSILHRLEVENFSSSDEYWGFLSSVVDSEGSLRFKHISKLACALLSLPFSNAAVERAFSLFKIVKDKLRNKMSIKTADAILRVRFSLMPDTCKKFEPTSKMIDKFTSEQMYQNEFEEEILDILNIE